MLYSKNCHNWFHITHVFQTFFIRSVQTWQNLKVTQNCKVLIVKNSKSDKFLILDKLIFQTTQKFANCAFNQFPLYSMLHYCKTVVSWILMSYVSISWKRVTFLFISILVAREDDSYYYLVFFKKITKNRIFFNYVTSLVLSYYFTVRWYDERFYFHKNFVKLSRMTLKYKNYNEFSVKSVSRKNTLLISRQVNEKWFHEVSNMQQILISLRSISQKMPKIV